MAENFIFSHLIFINLPELIKEYQIYKLKDLLKKLNQVIEFCQ